MKRYLIQTEDYQLLWTDDEDLALQYSESDIVIDLQTNRSLSSEFDVDAIEEAEPLEDEEEE